MKKVKGKPDYFYKRITDITVEDVKKMGVSALAVDLDNTAVKDSSYHMEKDVIRWSDKMRKNGIKIVIVSNTFFHRALWFSYKMGWVPFVALANKPSPLALKTAAKLIKTKVNSIAMIGDRLTKDVLCANRAGAVSVKVEAYA